MFVVELTYKVAIQVVDKFVAEHRQWLDDMYKANHFLCSGPQNPRSGGIIIALTKSASELQQILANDPFYINQVADYRLIEFEAIKYHQDIAQLIS